MVIIIFILVYYGYVGCGQNSDYLSFQYDIFFATFEKVRPGAERKLSNIFLKILGEIINSLLNMEPIGVLQSLPIYVYICKHSIPRFNKRELSHYVMFRK